MPNPTTHEITVRELADAVPRHHAGILDEDRPMYLLKLAVVIDRARALADVIGTAADHREELSDGSLGAAAILLETQLRDAGALLQAARQHPVGARS